MSLTASADPTITSFIVAFSDGDMSLSEVMGGKGANLAEMTRMGLPVPHGFTITTLACREYLALGREPANLGQQVGTRDPSTGETGVYGDFLPNAQAEDVVNGGIHRLRRWRTNTGVPGKSVWTSLNRTPRASVSSCWPSKWPCRC